MMSRWRRRERRSLGHASPRFDLRVRLGEEEGVTVGTKWYMIVRKESPGRAVSVSSW